MKHKLLFLLTGCLIGFKVDAQHKLSGTVLCAGSKGVQVHVFIYEINRITACDSTGAYEFTNIPSGMFTVQYSAIGFETTVKRISLNNDLQLNVNLEATGFEMEEVVVYGNYSSLNRQTPYAIEQLSLTEIRQQGSFNLSDAIGKLPGVSQLSTGPGISKPVIRGLSGNRIQTVMMGLRFDNQQWQDEHGLGLGDIGIDRVEVIKGPASLIYGSQAMGGVLNIIEEKPAPFGKTVTDFSTRIFSNTLGAATDFGVKKSKEKSYWRLRGGVESHADYTDGNGKRVLNSRFDNFVFKSTWGFTGKKWVSVNNLMAANSNFGFIMEAAQLNEKPDARLSRSFDMPHHTVYFQVLSSQNTLLLNGHSTIKLNAGVHLNNRQEQEGGKRIALNMQLNSFALNAMWVEKMGNNWELSTGVQSNAQTNRNAGARVIIPDANTTELAGVVYAKRTAEILNIEIGLRYDLTTVQSFATKNFTFGGINNIQPLNNAYAAWNASFGSSLVILRNWNIKLNTSTGYRAPNLAELSSNGLREGTIRWELGRMDLAYEQNLSLDFSLNYEHRQLAFEASVFSNRFLNYIYLAPTGSQYIGFDIYEYRQNNALLQGGELSVDYNPSRISWLGLHGSYGTVVGKSDNGNYLPYIPANRLTGEVKVQLKKTKRASLQFKISCVNVEAQNKPSVFETSTKGYYLVNSVLSYTLHAGARNISCSLTGNNLFNQVYFDHLSRFKYFGIYNMGRNISFNLFYPLITTKNKH